MSSNNLEKILKFLQIAERLKSAIRFLERKDILRESSAAHSWRMSLMAFVMAEEFKLKINIEKALEIAIVHDLAESITGDIDYLLIVEGKISHAEKKRRETRAMKKIRSILSKKTGEKIYRLWEEFEISSTREAKFIKALDRLETITHILYAGYKVYYKPETIPIYADESIKNFPELSGMLKRIKRELKLEFKKGDIPWKEEYDKF